MAMNRRMDGWPECFQDLRSWCHPDQDELNTPQISLQDEFNFSLEGQVNNCSNWGYVESQGELNDSWVNQELPLSSPNIMITEEENNNYSADIQSSFSLPFVKMDTSEHVSKVDYSEIEAPSSSVLKTKGNILLSQASLPREDSPTTGEAPVGFTDYIKLNSSQLIRLGNGGKLIKLEEPRVPAVEQHIPVVHPQLLTVPKKGVGEKTRPKLKLSIPQAPSTTNDSSTGNLTTPEVLKPLTDIPTSQFDLLKYVCEGQEYTSRTQSIPKKESVIPPQDHDYMDSKSTSNANMYIKCEPMSPSGGLIYSGARTSLPMDEEDFDSDPSGIMDEDDSESEEWSPGGKRPRRPSTSGKPNRRGRKLSSIDSSDGQDKYRALRDRNNEASRRSRLNRKQKDMEMRRHKSDLEKRNVELRVKADRMEALVKDMRAALLKSIKNSRHNSS